MPASRSALPSLLPRHFGKVAALGGLALLTACGTPQQQCINRNTRDLQVVDRLIGESEGVLQRGYALEEVETRQWQWGVCGHDVIDTPKGPVVVPDRCMVEVPTYSTRAVSVDLAAEKSKLTSMKRKRQQLATEAQPRIQECRAKYPE